MTDRESYIEAALAHAKEDLDHEVCGLVIVYKGQLRYHRCKNVAEHPKDNFIIATEDWVAADKLGEIVGVVHSHPRSRPDPSQADLVGCERSGLPWTIVNPRTEEFNVFEPTGYVAPLYKRVYCHGVLDCYSFVRDFYKQEYNLELRDYERPEEWWDKGLDLYMEHYHEEGFYPIEAKLLMPGDLILMNIASDKANHGAIYLGDNMMAHHLYQRLSSRDIYGGYYRKHTALCLRHGSINP